MKNKITICRGTCGWYLHITLFFLLCLCSPHVVFCCKGLVCFLCRKRRYRKSNIRWKAHSHTKRLCLLQTEYLILDRINFFLSIRRKIYLFLFFLLTLIKWECSHWIAWDLMVRVKPFLGQVETLKYIEKEINPANSS